MSFKAAMRAYLFSGSSLTNLLSESGTLGAALTAGAITTVKVSGLSSAPESVGQVLMKNAAGNYELINYTAATLNGADYDLTVSSTIAQSYAMGDYAAICVGVYSYPAPQESSLPYVLINRVATSEIYNRLNSPGLHVVETWQASCFAATDEIC